MSNKFVRKEKKKLIRKEKMTKEDEVIVVLNKMIAGCKRIKYSDFNHIVKEKRKGVLMKMEVADHRIGIRAFNYDKESEGYAISTASIIATLTDVLIGKRLAFIVDEKGYITGMKWWS